MLRPLQNGVLQVCGALLSARHSVASQQRAPRVVESVAFLMTNIVNKMRPAPDTRNHAMPYKISRIPKGNGKFRQIYIASPRLLGELKSLIPELEHILKKLDTCKANFGFQKGRNCALNAFQHVGFRYTISFDLADFFNSIEVVHVTGLIPKRIVEKCFIDGNPKQGLPTSPLISNIAFLRCDSEIIAALGKMLSRFVYTRYADDLTISFETLSDVTKISFVLKQIAERNGFKINSGKTKLQDQNNGNVIITGIGLNESGLVATRKTRRKIRAAVHQKNRESEQGLIEWSKCKLPNDFYR